MSWRQNTIIYNQKSSNIGSITDMHGRQTHNCRLKGTGSPQKIHNTSIDFLVYYKVSEDHNLSRSLLWIWVSTIKPAIVANGVQRMEVKVTGDVNDPGVNLLPITPSISAIQPCAMLIRFNALWHPRSTAQRSTYREVIQVIPEKKENPGARTEGKTKSLKIMLTSIGKCPVVKMTIHNEMVGGHAEFTASIFITSMTSYDWYQFHLAINASYADVQ